MGSGYVRSFSYIVNFLHAVISTRIDFGQAAGLAVATRKPVDIEYHYGTETLASMYSSYIVPNGSPLTVSLTKVTW